MRAASIWLIATAICGFSSNVTAQDATAPMACDWHIASDVIDSMTDERKCLIVSKAGQIGVGVRGGDVTFVTSSAYRSPRDSLTLRVDDNPAIALGENISTASFGDNARRALEEIRHGARLRTRFSDYPRNREGDVAICNLPDLIASCSAAK